MADILNRALREDATNSVRPHLEWQWGRLVIHSGSLRTKAQAEELIALLGLFVERLPPIKGDPHDPNDPVPPEDEGRPFPATSRAGAP